MAVGEMWLSRTAIRRRQETLPSVRHPTAPEPLMLHSARDEKGMAQESIGSWAFLVIILLYIIYNIEGRPYALSN